MKYKYLFFDLDGTLTDSAPGIIRSVKYALDKFGIVENDEAALLRFIGPPLPDSFRDFYGFDDEKAALGVKYYREYYADNGIFENSVYEGICELLEMLCKKGHILYLATSKPYEYALRILEKFGLSRFFTGVCGSTMDEKNGGKAFIVSKALELSRADKKDVLMIGDRHHDIEGAAVNGIDSLGVLYGYGNYEEFVAAGATYIANTVSDISNFV